MPSYTLEIQAFGIYTANMPSLEIWEDGVLDSTHSVTSSGSTISVTINYGGSLPTSLALTFNDIFPAAGRSIEIRSVKINNMYVNVGNYLSSDNLTKGQSATVDIDSINTNDSDFIFDGSAPPAASEFTVGATRTFTAGIDNFPGHTLTTDEVFNLLGGNDYAVTGSGNDKISGDAGDDVIYSKGGNDLVFGDIGDDRLYGGDGDDRLFGGDGDDRIHGEEGNDEIHGGLGNDTLNGHNGNDTITGGDGEDKLNGGAGTDYLFGGNDNDNLVGGAGNDTLDGGDGDDIIYGGADDDILNGGDGNDTLIGNVGVDTIHGDDGDDTIYIMTNDWSAGEAIYGGVGTDELILTTAMTIDFTTGVIDGLETLTGSNGNQDVTYTIQQALSFSNIDLGGGADISRVQFSGVLDVTALSTPTVTNVENGYILGSAGVDDIIISGGQLDALVFGTGTIDFGASTDILNLTSTSTNLNTLGLADGSILGLEQINASNAAASVTINISGQSEDFSIIGSNNADTISGGSGDHYILGRDGDDIITAQGGSDSLYGGLGNDTINGGAGDDIILGDGVFIDTSTLISYDPGQDLGGTATQLGNGVNLSGNAWKRIFVDYDITANTVLEFDFRSTVEGEISGIGFDNDNDVFTDIPQLFKIHGTQNFGNLTYDNYAGTGEWTHYTINVGSFYTGNFDYLTLASDDDIAPQDSNSYFANIIIYDTTGGGSVADGNDILTGGAGADIINGGGGNDTFNLANGDFIAGESIIGGAGTDNITLTNATTVDLTIGTINTVEDLIGSSGNDDVTYTIEQALSFSNIDLGGGTDNSRVQFGGILDVTALSTPTVTNVENGFLRGSTGNDGLVITGAQLDTLIYGAGGIDFDTGTDYLVVTSTSTVLNTLGLTDGSILRLEEISAYIATAPVTITMSGQTENLILEGSGFADTISGGSGNDTINGLAGADILNGNNGNDTFLIYFTETRGDEYYGGAGTDTLQMQGDVYFNSANVFNSVEYLITGFATIFIDVGQTVNLSGFASVVGPTNLISAGTGATSETIIGTLNGDTITTFAGNDFITGGLGADIINAGDDDDTIYLANGDFVAGESIDGGANIDTLILTNATTVNFTTGTITAVENLNGSSGNDDVTYTIQQALAFTAIDLGGGTDTSRVQINGTVDAIPLGTPTVTNAENGFLTGSTGADTLTISGAQLDALIFGTGTIDFNTGTDVLNLTSTSADLNTLFGTDISVLGLEEVNASTAGAGVTIRVFNQTENFTVIGSNFNDFLDGGLGNDLINGGLGNDLLRGRGGLDIINGGAGNDTFNLANGDFVAGESLDGGADIDEITFLNATTVNFTTGTLATIETLTGSAGNDNVTIGAGQLASGFVTINLAGGTDVLTTNASGTNDISSSGLATISNVETGNIIASTGNDTFTATGAQLDALISGSGTINFNTGSDTLNITSTSADLNLLGLGSNASVQGLETISASTASAGVTITMSAQTEAFSMTGSGFADVLTGGAAIDTINGGAGADILTGLGGNDIINGGDGNDTILGGNGNDTLTGGNGNDTIYGATIIGESGLETVVQSTTTLWHSVSFSAAILNPVIKMTILTNNGGDPYTVRVRDVTETGFEWQIDEWDYLNGTRAVAETVSWLAIASGTHTLDNGLVVQAGTTTATNENFTSVSFNAAFGSAPVVMTQVMSDNDGAAVGGRNRNRTATGFQTSMLEEEDADGTHATETIGWIAIDNGGSVGSGFLVDETGDTVTHTVTTVNFPTAFANVPVVIYDMQTTDGGDTAVMGGDGVTASSVSFHVAEEQSRDVEVGHTTEVVGYFALNEGLLTSAGGGNNTLSGGAGLDTLYGGDGADTFIFEAASAYADRDILADFSAGEGDILDISDLITGFSGTITDYVFFDDSSGTDTIIQIDGNGLTGGTSFQTIAIINGVTGLDEATLYANGNIVV